MAGGSPDQARRMVAPAELQEVSHRNQDARTDAARVELLLADQVIRCLATKESICGAAERPTNTSLLLGSWRLGGFLPPVLGCLHSMTAASFISRRSWLSAVAFLLTRRSAVGLCPGPP